MDIANLYDTYKPLLFSIAYRMLGSVADAEDMVQDTFMHAQQLQEDQVQHTKAYLCKMVTNRCIDYAQSARKRRELYVGDWLPEPLLLNDDDPLHAIERDETFSYAFMVYMEKLTPVERAVFILREAFEYEYTDIGEIVGKSEANCRQIFSRLKRKLQEDQAPAIHADEHAYSLAQQVLQASSTGNLEGLIRSLTEDVILYSDGGGKAVAALHPILGRDRVMRFLLGIYAKNQEHYQYHLVNMNGQSGIIVTEEGKPVTAINIELDAEGRVHRLFFMRNPDKLNFDDT
ncbi:RNA polymerase sigma-70 factor [Paenibacillus sedimenti]|uniref:RNA polymerase sigma-70 factor n=1 Tax=Paenibacillus sedimenti TaxID=2770274 RepID=A0A926QK54_9BACL|nr:RNA polymerase sigma-70 factor [Paenibacillus sedimenti]MBD0382451.1 RNA polymerase sigma-70 factor [Paenibacillus sedimenti]